MDPVPRNRLAFVTAELLDIEYGLRGLAEATTDGPYAESLVNRIQAGLEAVHSIKANEPATTAELDPVITALQSASLTPDNKAALITLADQVKAQNEAFLAAHNGSDLPGVDSLLPL
jgi:hypothetical protein